MEQWDLHGWVPGASSVDLLLQSRWTAWPPCRYNQFNVCCIFPLPVASNHPWYSNISTRKEKSWPSLYGAAQRTGETNRKEQQVTFSLSLSSVDLCLCQQIQMGGGRWPMEPKPAVWKPHRSLLQWQGELQCSSRCKTIFQEKRSDNKSFIGGGLPVDRGWLCSGRTNQGTHSPGDVPEY